MKDLRKLITVAFFLRFSFGVGMMFCSLLAAVSPALSDDHGKLERHYEDVYEHSFKNEDHGNETTGEIAAWMFGVANFPVALSIILKTIGKMIPGRQNVKDMLVKFNRHQKKYLMKLHFWLNPVALGIALTHFSPSTCRTTALPEWGFGVMLAIVLLGLIMKFKLSPASMRQNVFKFHTSPVLLIAAVSILLIGHSIAD